MVPRRMQGVATTGLIVAYQGAMTKMNLVAGCRRMVALPVPDIRGFRTPLPD